MITSPFQDASFDEATITIDNGFIYYPETFKAMVHSFFYDPKLSPPPENGHIYNRRLIKGPVIYKHYHKLWREFIDKSFLQKYNIVDESRAALAYAKRGRKLSDIFIQQYYRYYRMTSRYPEVIPAFFDGQRFDRIVIPNIQKPWSDLNPFWAFHPIP